MMKKTYESPEFEKWRYSFESMMESIHYSKDEDYQHSGDEGGDDVVVP